MSVAVSKTISEARSQSYDFELQQQRCKKITTYATSSLMRFENKNIFFYIGTMKNGLA
jgi:hypothetical protein